MASRKVMKAFVEISRVGGRWHWVLWSVLPRRAVASSVAGYTRRNELLEALRRDMDKGILVRVNIVERRDPADGIVDEARESLEDAEMA